jgi:CheY-like chemotaxis protein
MKKRILLISSAQTTHAFIRIALAEVAEVSSAYSLTEALDFLDNDRFDGIFTGLTCIGTETEKYADLIARLKEAGQSPVVVYTAQMMCGEKDICLNAGAADFIALGTPRATSRSALGEIVKNL